MKPTLWMGAVAASLAAFLFVLHTARGVMPALVPTIERE